MRKVIFLFPVLAALLLAAVAPMTAANAATTGDCQAKIDALATQTTSVQLLGARAETDRTGLLGKLDDASTKLAEGKFSDAIGKLTDFRSKVVELDTGAKPKIAAQDAATLTAGADDAISCIQSL